MKKRSLYKLELINDAGRKYVCVIRTDNNYGVQGYVYPDGRVDKRYTPYAIPNYIASECVNMLNEQES